MNRATFLSLLVRIEGLVFLIAFAAALKRRGVRGLSDAECGKQCETGRADLADCIAPVAEIGKPLQRRVETML
jgi:hypothetical protein